MIYKLASSASLLLACLLCIGAMHRREEPNGYCCVPPVYIDPGFVSSCPVAPCGAVPGSCVAQQICGKLVGNTCKPQADLLCEQASTTYYPTNALSLIHI